jgi:hypothetical protein
MEQRRFPNPWKDILNNDTLSVREVIMAIQWGAPSNRLTPEIRDGLDECWRASHEGDRVTRHS